MNQPFGGTPIYGTPQMEVPQKWMVYKWNILWTIDDLDLEFRGTWIGILNLEIDFTWKSWGIDGVDHQSWVYQQSWGYLGLVDTELRIQRNIKKQNIGIHQETMESAKDLKYWLSPRTYGNSTTKKSGIYAGKYRLVLHDSTAEHGSLTDRTGWFQTSVMPNSS